MRAYRLMLISLLVLAVATAAPAGQNDKLMKEVEAIGDVIARAMVEDDIDTMLALYTDDAISLPNYQPRLQGTKAFREHHAEMSAAGMEVVSFESEPTEVWKAGDQVIEIGTYVIGLTMPGGAIEDRGKYMTVYVREDGKLKIKAEIWNTDMNPMEMTGTMGGEAHGHGEGDGHEH